MASEHAELVGEMVALEKMQMSERLKHAKKRRSQQLKTFMQYEKQLEKETGKKGRKILSSNSSSKSEQTKSLSRLRFEESILLLDAASRNDVEEVRNLLTAGVSPDVCNEDGLTALHQCSIDNLEEMMKLLIEHGADVSRRDSELWTPLHAAATCGHTRICKYLVERGADLLAVNADGNMPYDLCEDVGSLDYIESEMARRGVTQELIDNTRLSVENQMLSDLRLIASQGGSLEYRGQNGETPLHIAACNGYIYVMEFLLSHHVSLDVRDRDEWQPIHCAACWGQLAIIEMLLENGADFEARTKSGETTLDLCEDVEMKQRVLEIIEDVERKRPHKPRENITPRRNSTARRGSVVTTLALRRSSVHEKTSIAQKEAQLEAMRLRESVLFQEDEDEDETVIDAITLPQANINNNVVDINNITASVMKSKEEKPLKPIISVSKVGNRKANETKENGTKDVSLQLPREDEIWLPCVDKMNDQQLHSQGTETADVPDKESLKPGTVATQVPNNSATKNSEAVKLQLPHGTTNSNAKDSKKQIETGSSKVDNMKSGSNFLPVNGNSSVAIPSGTLAELKQKRAKRMTQALSVLTSGDSSLPNGSSGENNVSRVDSSGDGSRRKYTNKEQVVRGSSSNKEGGCCIMM